MRPVPTAGRDLALPLHALLSRALVAFTIEADNVAERRLPHRTAAHGPAAGAPPGAPWLISLAMWASSLRHIPDAGITVAGLRQAARTGTSLAGLRRWGYVTFDPEPTSGKQPADRALIRLTAQGRIARDGWAPLGDVVEQRWRDRFGAQAIAGLRAALTAITADLDPSLPDCLPILGYGLFSRVPARDPQAPQPDPRAAQPGTPPRRPAYPKPPSHASHCGRSCRGLSFRSVPSTRASRGCRWRSAPTSCGC